MNEPITVHINQSATYSGHLIYKSNRIGIIVAKVPISNIVKTTVRYELDGTFASRLISHDAHSQIAVFVTKSPPKTQPIAIRKYQSLLEEVLKDYEQSDAIVFPPQPIPKFEDDFNITK